MLIFEIPAVKCLHGVEVNWSRYRDTGVTDPALISRRGGKGGRALNISWRIVVVDLENH